MTTLTISVFGRKHRIEMTDEELIKAYAETQCGYIENEILDGYKDAAPGCQELVNSLYEDITSRRKCEISIDGITFDHVFPENIKFLTTDVIKKILTETYNGVF